MVHRSGALTVTPSAAHGSVGIVVPCLNEAASLPYLFSRMPSGIDEVILVDGGSTDDSVQVAARLWPSLRIVTQTRRGKGNALACGFAAAASDIIVTVDADGSADPAEIPRFVAALRDGAHFAKGTRFGAGGGSDDITPLRRGGNGALTALVNRLYATSFTDLCYGYNAFWRSIVPIFDLPELAGPVDAASLRPGDGFEIETLVLLRAVRAGLRIVEVPSHEAHRMHGTSNLRTLVDGSRVLSTILHEWRVSRRASPVAQAPVSPVAGPVPSQPDAVPAASFPTESSVRTEGSGGTDVPPAPLVPRPRSPDAHASGGAVGGERAMNGPPVSR
jgi:hypothetical protein